MSDIKLTNRVDQAVARLTAKKEGHVGKIVQVMGPVVDIQFPEGSLPAIFNAIEIDGNPTKDIHIHLTRPQWTPVNIGLSIGLHRPLVNSQQKRRSWKRASRLSI